MLVLCNKTNVLNAKVKKTIGFIMFPSLGNQNVCFSRVFSTSAFRMLVLCAKTDVLGRGSHPKDFGFRFQDFGESLK